MRYKDVINVVGWPTTHQCFTLWINTESQIIMVSGVDFRWNVGLGNPDPDDFNVKFTIFIASIKDGIKGFEKFQFKIAALVAIQKEEDDILLPGDNQ